MSKIYDAIIQAAKNSDSRAAVFRSSTDQKVALPRLSSRLAWKITGAVAAVMLAFGLLLIIIANQFLDRALRSEIDQRALAIATNLSDAAAGPVIGKIFWTFTRCSQSTPDWREWHTPLSKILTVRSLAIA